MLAVIAPWKKYALDIPISEDARQSARGQFGLMQPEDFNSVAQLLCVFVYPMIVKPGVSQLVRNFSAFGVIDKKSQIRLI